MTFKRTIFTAAGLAIPGLALAGSAGLNELIGDLPDGKAVIITHAVTIDSGTSVTSQGTVSGGNFPNVATDDPDTGTAGDATVTQVQLVPTVSNLARNINEDQTVPFGTADFDGGFSDGNAGDTLQVVRITSLPTTGTLRLSGVPITTAPTDIPRAQIANLDYVPQPDFGGPTDSFGWTASDGTDFAASPASYTFNITEQNDPPTPGSDTVVRYASSSLKIPVVTLLANDSDSKDSPQDLPLTVTDVNYTGGNGATVTLSGGVVFYNPNGHLGNDEFTYELTDSRGGKFLNVPVTVEIFDDTAQSLNIQVSIDPGGGDATVDGVGVPGRVYRVQAADTGIPNWFDLPGGAVVAGPNGQFSYVDPGPLPPTRIYRTVHP